MPNVAFMGNLPDWVTNDEIESWLSSADVGYDRVRVVRDPETQESKGYAFIEAATREDLEALIKRFHRAPIDDRVLRVTEAQAPAEAGAKRRRR